jgi:hypothetical protein
VRQHLHQPVGRPDQRHRDLRLFTGLERHRLPDARAIHRGVEGLGHGKRAFADRARLVLRGQQQHGCELGPDRGLAGAASLTDGAGEELRNPGALDEPLLGEAGRLRGGTAPRLDDDAHDGLRMGARRRGHHDKQLSGIARHDQRRNAVEADRRRLRRETRAPHAHEVAGHAARRLDGAHERESAEVELSRWRAAPPGREDDRVEAPGRPGQLRHLEAHRLRLQLHHARRLAGNRDRETFVEAAPAHDHLVSGKGPRRVERHHAKRSEHHERDRPRPAGRRLDGDADRARGGQHGDLHVDAVARRRAGDDRQRAEPYLVVGRMAVEAGAGDRDRLPHLGLRGLERVDLRGGEEEALHQPAGQQEDENPADAEPEQPEVHVGHAQCAARAARGTARLSSDAHRRGRGLRLARGRRRWRGRLGDRSLGNAQLQLGRRRRDLAPGGHELDRVPVDESGRLDRLAVDPGALAAPVVDHRDAEVVPDDLDVGELDLGVVQPQVREAARADDHRQARVQPDVVPVDRAADDQDRWWLGDALGHCPSQSTRGAARRF